MLNARAHFPGLLDKVFLDAACVSLAARPAVEAIQRFLDLAMVCPLDSSTHHHIFMDEMRSAARPAAARLINAHEDEVALVESTTHGLALAANAIPLEPSDHVLLSDLEFLQVAVPWVQKAKKDGIEVTVVPNRNGEVRVEDFAERLTTRTRVITVSTVQWTNGYRLDLAALGRLCHERGIWLVADATQQLGAIPLDVRQTPVDILACGGHKWLNSPFGCGFLYINHDVLLDLLPPLAGYLSIEDPPGGWDEYFQSPDTTPVKNYKFVNAARRFDRIAEHIYALTDQLIAGLDRLGVRIVTPRARENRSGIVTFSVGSAQENVNVMQRLLEKKILTSVRYTSNVGGIRVSCHFYNSAEDIDTLLAELKKIVSSR